MSNRIALTALLLAVPLSARADFTGKTVKIGVLNDQTGPYSEPTGRGSVIAAQMAVEDFGGKVSGTPVEVIAGDHQNKPDLGASIARQWFDVEGVDAIADVPTTSVALAVSLLAKEKNKVLLISGGASSDLTGKACSPNTVHWTYDTWALANASGRAQVKAGGDTWYFLTVDYAFGVALERDTTAAVVASGGKVLGSLKHPLNTHDFSSFLLQAQASHAKVIGLANAGSDTINAVKGAAEFGLTRKGQKLAGLLMNITDVHALGLRAAEGLQLAEAFYWDRDAQTRAFSNRFAERAKGKKPTMIHAGVYAAVTHYLKALAKTGSDEDGRAVVAAMKALPTDDALFGKGTIRADGRKLHPMYLFEVKSPGESKYPWDYYTTRAVIPAEEAFRPLAQGECPLVTAQK